MQLKDIPVGSIVYHPTSKYYNQPIKFRKLADGHHKAGNTLLVTDKIISFKAFDAKEPGNSDTDRRNYGNNNWELSNIRQWLNSNLTSWFTPTHSADSTPNAAGVSTNPYDTEKGFMANLDPQFREAIQNTTLKVAKANVDGGGVNTLTDKVFLLSRTELGLGNESTGADGTPIPYFNSDSRRQAVGTPESLSNADGKNDGYYWTRSPYADYSYNTRRVLSNGSLNSNHSYYGYNGVRPALNLESSLLVKSVANGEYEISFNQAPTISGTDESLGNISDTISRDYTVFDADGDKLSIVERLNNKVLNYYNEINSGTSKVLNIPKEKIYELPIGETNTISIEVSDGKETVFRRWTFIRINTAPIIEVITPADIGITTLTPTIKYMVSDLEGDAVNTKIRLGTEIVHQATGVTQDTEIQFTIPHEKWITLDQGEYTITIEAEDAQAGESQEKIRFTKVEDQINITTGVLETEIRVEQIIPIAWLNIIGASVADVLKVFVTNNGFDATPTWEEVTAETIAGEIYQLTNVTKTNAKWGLAVKAEVKTEGSGA